MVDSWADIVGYWAVEGEGLTSVGVIKGDEAGSRGVQVITVRVERAVNLLVGGAW